MVEQRTRLGLTQAAVADMLDVAQATYQRWERGTREPSFSDLERVAAIFGVSVAELLSGSASVAPLGPQLFVKGNVAAGIWREAWQWDQTDWQSFTGSPHTQTPLEHRFGLRVIGDSMDMIFPSGTILECVSSFYEPALTSGRKVIVVRERSGGEFEATVKEYFIDSDGQEWLIPRSNNPAFQRPIALNEPEPGIVETRVVAVVIAAIIQV